MDRLALLVVILVALAACSDVSNEATSLPSAAAPTAEAPSDPPPTGETPTSSTTTAEGTTTSPPTTLPLPEIPDQLEGFETATVTVGGEPWWVAIADTSSKRRQGLMQVEDLLDLDGMLFVFPDDGRGGFWMKDTLIPLDIAFFRSDGSLVEVLTMTPCTTSDCPSYRPGDDYRYALEAPEGALGDLPATVRLEL